MAEGCREVRSSMDRSIDRSIGAPRSERRGAEEAKVASAATPRGSASPHAVSAERPPQNTRFLPALPTRKLSPCGNGHSLLHPQPPNKTQHHYRNPQLDWCRMIHQANPNSTQTTLQYALLKGVQGLGLYTHGQPNRDRKR